MAGRDERRVRTDSERRNRRQCEIIIHKRVIWRGGRLRGKRRGDVGGG